MHRLISWSRTRGKDNITTTEPTKVTGGNNSQDIENQPQEPAIICQVVEVLSASDDQDPSLEFPLDNLRMGVVLEGPHRGLPGFSRGSAITIGRVLLKRPCTAYRSADREAVVWRAVPRHPHILQFYGACKITRQWYYAVPYLHLSPMLVYLQSYPEADRGALVLQVCDALKALHASNIVHSQVGITKILVTGNRALLYDFCQSRNQGQGFEEDVFDFGLTIAEILRGKQYNHRIFRLLRTHPHRPPWASPDRVAYGPVWDIAAWCWRPNPSQRPTAPEIFDSLSKALGPIRVSEPPTSVADGAVGDSLPSEDFGHSVVTNPRSEPPPKPRPQLPTSDQRARPRSAPSTPMPPRRALPQEPNGQWTECIAFPGLPALRYRRIQGIPHASGGFSDVWMCETTYSDQSRQLVAEKVLRRATRLEETEGKLLKKLTQEVSIWRNLHHPNIAPLMGFTIQPSIALISPWYANGNVQRYINLHRDCDRLKLLHEITRGLTYLHQFAPPVVHGDIKPDNILIDDDGSAVIIDFGLSRSLVETVPGLISSNRGAGNVRWMAPELVDGILPKSLKGDVYSFASLALNILTGAIPFRNFTNETALIVALVTGSPPRLAPARKRMSCKPALEERLWKLLDECWATNPAQRPTMREIERRIQELRRLDAVVAEAQPVQNLSSTIGSGGKGDEKEKKRERDQLEFQPEDMVNQAEGGKPPTVAPSSPKISLLAVPEGLQQRARGRLVRLMRFGRTAPPVGQP
ncbi:hypothetical protein FS837_012740 [Tulasnella sp. UAMH 9824]|nr:hypothetical protein FS837_012740 [Tulasnella sp. UAMH 9824]